MAVERLGLTIGESFEATIRDVKPAAELGGEGDAPIAILDKDGQEAWYPLPNREFAQGMAVVVTPKTLHRPGEGSTTFFDITVKTEGVQSLE